MLPDRPILIDSRAGSGPSYIPVKGQPGVRRRLPPLTEFHPLDTLAQLYPFPELGYGGDVTFTGNGPDDTPVQIAAEVKSLEELITALSTSRLQTQLTEMTTCGFDYCYLIYYGRYRASPTLHKGVHKSYYTTQKYQGVGKIRNTPSEIYKTLKSYRKDPSTGIDSPIVYHYLERALVEIAQAGIHVINVPSKRHVAIYIGDVLYPWWSKYPWSSHSLFDTFQIKPPASNVSSLLPDISPDVYHRASVCKEFLRNIGWNRAMSAAHYFTGGMGHMLTCYDVKVWAGLPNWGEVLANKVVGVLRDGAEELADVNNLASDMRRLRQKVEGLGKRWLP